MLTVSKEFHDAFKGLNREVYARIQIKDKIFENNQIKSIEYSTGVLGGENFQIGSTQSATAKIVIPEIVEDLKELDEVKIEIGIKIPGSGLPTNINDVSPVGKARVNRARLISYVPDRFEFVPLGTFYISEKVDPDRNENLTTIEVRDAFVFLESMYESKLSYPTKIAEVALEIANMTGSVIDPVSFSHLSNYIVEEPIGYTYRQAIGLIAQFEAGFACFDRLGRIAIRTLADPLFTIEPGEYYQKGLVKNELAYQLKGLSCKVVQTNNESENETVVLHVGSTEGAQISIENNLMSEMLLSDVFQKVEGLNFPPISLKWRGNPALEPGDWVTMFDRAGKPFKTPVLNYSLTFDGGLVATIGSDTKSYAGSVSTFRGPLQQKLDEIDYRIDAAGKNNVYSGNEEPKYPKEGDIWFKKNGPDDEIWVYQQVALGVFEWVLKTSTAMDQDIKDKIDNATPSDEIVKTINLSDEMDGNEWLKITGAKIWLTDETKIDNAIITAAMIASIDAGTINTGTLNAANVNIINLNADSISSGTIKGIRIVGSTISSVGTSYEMKLQNGSIDWNRTSDGSFGASLFANAQNDFASGSIYLKLGSTSTGFDVYFEDIGQLERVFSIGITGLPSNGYRKPKLSAKTSEIYFSDILTPWNPDSSKYYSFSLTNASFNLAINGGEGIRSIGITASQIVLSNASSSILTLSKTGMNYSGTKTTFQANVNVDKDLRVYGTKNASHVTRDGVRLTPAYETAESFLGDIGRGITDSQCQVWVPIELLFSDVVNLDIPYEVFLQAYDNARVWVSDFRSDAFLVCSTKPFVRFVWEIKAKRLGYENERLVLTDDTNKSINRIWGETHE